MPAAASVEVAERADCSRVIDLWVDLATDQRAHGSHVRGEPSRSAIADEVSRRIAADAVLVAREESSIVGFAALDRERDGYERDVDRGRVTALYVRPTHRSSGLGSRLLDRAEAHLADVGIDVVTLEALADNDRARSFYRDLGYEPHRVSFERSIESDTHSSAGRESRR